MKLTRLLYSLALLIAPPAWGECPGMVLAHLVDGAGWKSSIYLLNGSPSTKANYTLTFRGDNGQPVLVSFADGRRDNQISGAISGGGIAILETPGGDTDPLTVASATLTTGGTVSGFAVIRERQAGGPDREATVSLVSPAGKTLVFPFDNSAGFLSSVALALPCAPGPGATVTAVATDEAGVSLGKSDFKIMQGGHMAFMVGERFPGAKGKRGVIRISVPANTYLAGLGLRFTPAGALTTFPPTASAPPPPPVVTRSYRTKKSR